MDQACLIILETQGGIYNKFGSFLIRDQHTVRRVKDEAELMTALSAEAFDAIIAADPLPRFAVADLFANLKKHTPLVPVIFVAQNASVRRAVEAIQCGAKDYLLISDSELVLAKHIENILKLKSKQNNELSKESKESVIITGSPAMRQVLEMAQRVAPSSATVLIQGESGTGKELLARFIHTHSGRIKHGFVAMNCAALPDNLAESELFGYERGAFTGAMQRKLGKFEQADNGTLLLDEISEMPLAMQAKLLRVLQEKEVDRIGGQKSVAVNVRVIATTNRDLAQMVRQGGFRQDLYYRLRVIPLTIPPLRLRESDIALLVDYFLKKHGSTNAPPLRFDAAAMEKIRRWNWPGNVREMENTIERAVLIRSGSLMGPELLLMEEELKDGPTQSTAQLVGLTVKDLEERLIVQTLRHVDQNRTQAAEMLGISIRTLRNKLHEYRQDQADLPQAAEGG